MEGPSMYNQFLQTSEISGFVLIAGQPVVQHGDQPGEVGEGCAFGLQSGRPAHADRFPRLETMEVPSKTQTPGDVFLILLLSAARSPFLLLLRWVWVTSLHTLRCSILQPGNTQRNAAGSYSLGILKAIDDEWQKTQCMPRETCVDVAKELGTTTSMFFKPPCVSVFRCNGCCNTEGVSCRNTSTTYVNKTLLSVIPFKYGPEPVLIKVANHTECKCMEPPLIRRQAHIRSHRRNGCSPMRQLSKSENSRRLCASGLIWDCMADRCVFYPSTKQPDFSPSMRTEDCEIDVDRCDCVPDRATLSPRPSLTQDPDYATLHVT